MVVMITAVAILIAVSASRSVPLTVRPIRPLFAMVINPRLNYTPGGIRTDLQGRAIALKDGKPIEGLYVVGEASGGLHGQERMTGCSMPECAVFGMIAGESAAQRKSI